MPRPNSLDALRLTAAWLVLFSHSYAIYGLGYEPLARTPTPRPSAGWRSALFFVISGYLITASYLSRRSLPAFALDRALRIMPGLTVVILLTTFVLGPLATTLPVREYFAQKHSYKYLYNILIFPVHHGLPGVFKTNPFTALINGSIWTLSMEVTFYAAVGALGKAGLLGPHVDPGGGGLPGGVHPPLAVRRCPAATIFFMNCKALAKHGYWFFAGEAVFATSGGVVLRRPAVCAALMIVAAAARTPFAYPTLVALLPFPVLALGLARVPGLTRAAQFGDFSYGFYLYAFPVQQTYMHMVGRAWGFGPFVVTCSIIALACGVASWHLVERPARQAQAIGRHAGGGCARKV